MKNLILLCGLLLSPSLANADMVRSDSIANDPAKEKLCASRAKGKTVPFEIDSEHVKSARAFHPDATFIATDGDSPQLIECHLREGTGRFEPDSFSPEQDYWHTIKPKLNPASRPTKAVPWRQIFASKRLALNQPVASQIIA